MVTCPECGKDVKEAKFCSNCGALLPAVDEAVEEKMEDVAVNVVKEESASEESVDETSEEVVEESASEESVDETSEEVVEEPASEESVDETSEEVVEEPASEERVEVVVEDASEEVVEEESFNEEPAANEANIVKKTKFCSNCGREVGIETAFCPQCGFKLIQEEKPQTKFCQSCGKKINIDAEICPYCGVRVANIVRNSQEKNSLLAAILSFLFPGLGHLYLGLNKKGISFIIVYIVSAFLILLLIGIVLVIIVWLWALIDSIKSTEAINRGEFVEDKLF